MINPSISECFFFFAAAEEEDDTWNSYRKFSNDTSEFWIVTYAGAHWFKFGALHAILQRMSQNGNSLRRKEIWNGHFW